MYNDGDEQMLCRALTQIMRYEICIQLQRVQRAHDLEIYRHVRPTRDSLDMIRINPVL